MSDDRVKLKSCPWCHRDDCLELGERLGWQIIYCDYCGACGPYPVGKLTPEEAWNTRTLDPSIESLQAEVERLRHLVRSYVDPFGVVPADHAIVLALGTDDEEGYHQALAAKEQTR
jgi:hypothetical protein